MSFSLTPCCIKCQSTITLGQVLLIVCAGQDDLGIRDVAYKNGVLLHRYQIRPEVLHPNY